MEFNATKTRKKIDVYQAAAILERVAKPSGGPAVNEKPHSQNKIENCEQLIERVRLAAKMGITRQNLGG